MPYNTGMTFKNRLFLLLLLVIGLQLLVISIYVHHRIADILDHEIGNRALVQARQIATHPRITPKSVNTLIRCNALTPMPITL